MRLLQSIQPSGELVKQVESPDAELHMLLHLKAQIEIRDCRYADFRLEVVITARANERAALRGASRESARSRAAIVAIVVLIPGRRPVDILHQVNADLTRDQHCT